MLFNSFQFIFLFLPITLLGFYLIGKKGYKRASIAWLIGASLVFYGWWNPAYLGLIIFSVFFNYSIGVLLSKAFNNRVLSKIILTVGISANLVLLGYYKYANFFADNLNILSGSNLILNEVILPLAISFFTFQQITYLVETHKGEVKESSFLNYCLFVTFFPQLIAGPIVQHKEIMPQFKKGLIYKLQSKHLAVGLTIFALGLFKKVVLADGISAYATPVFDAAESGVEIIFFEAWIGALAYTFQLYFDFSGYADMAIGIARMFGIRLPLNFNSPYKATSIIDFWRRWHITLSRFLLNYLYIPLGGNRKGRIRRHTNLMITMLLGGLWHGADWTFLLWGGLHGFYLILNHGWRAIFNNKKTTRLGTFFAWAITFLAVVVSWVPFRAESLSGAKNLLHAMVGGNGILEPVSINNIFHSTLYVENFTAISWIFMLLLISTVFPNTQQFMCNHEPALDIYKGKVSRLKYKWLEWNPTKIWALLTSVILVISVLLLNKYSEFLYYRF